MTSDPVASVASLITADLPLATAGARVMLAQLDRIEALEAGARSGDDPEDVHRMRVATRRLRAARRVFGGALDAAILDRANAELKTLAAALGRVRDLDVFVAALRRQLEGAPEADRPALERMIAAREAARPAAQADLRALLDSGATDYVRGEFRRVLETLAGETGGETPGKGGRSRKGGTAVRRTAPRLILKALRRLYRDEPDLLAPTSAELHERRIAAKRARYACEFFAPAFGDALHAPIARLTAVQDVLGEIHDADVAVGVLLGEIERVSAIPAAAQGEAGAQAARAPDAGPFARLAARYFGERDAHLLTFRERWRALPRPKELRRALRAGACKEAW